MVQMTTHCSVLALRIPGTGEPDGLPSMGSHRVGHDWSDLAAAAAAYNEILSNCSKEWERRDDPGGRSCKTYPSRQHELTGRSERPHGCRACKLHVNCDVQLVGAEESVHYKSSIVAVLLWCFWSISTCPALMVYTVPSDKVLCFVPLSIRKWKMYSGLLSSFVISSYH